MAGLTHSEAGVYKDYELTLHHSNVFVAIAVGVGVTAMSVLVILGLELFLRDNPQSKMLRFDMLREEHLQTTVRNTQIMQMIGRAGSRGIVTEGPEGYMSCA